MRKNEIKKINQGNTLIANFMNVEFHPTEVYLLKYHESWDWLMKVIGVIGDWHNQMDYETAKLFDEAKLELFTRSILCPIGPIWEDTVNFVKWYDENKKLKTI